MTMKENRILKALSYIFLPILIAIILLSVIYTFAKDECAYYQDDYFETISFTHKYMNLISDLAETTIFTSDEWTMQTDGDYRIYYIDLRNYQNDVKDNYILIMYGNKVVTNVRKNTVEEIKTYIQEQDGEKVKIINGNHETTSMIRKFI